MVQRISRRIFLGSTAAFGVIGGAAMAAPPAASLRPVLRGEEFHKRAVRDVESIIRENRLTGRVAYAVAEARSGDWLECRNEQTGTPPASVTKAVTALYALETLGAEYRFRTQLCITGGMKNGEVLGDLVLVGGGDPTLDTNHLAEMAGALKEVGVRAVRGEFKIYVGRLPRVRQIDSEQPDHVGYNPAVSGVALNYNRVHFEWKRAGKGFNVTMDGRSNRYRPDVTMARMQIMDRSTPVYTYEDAAGRDNWTVARKALGNGGARWLPVRKPGLYAGEVFATMAGAHGIRLGKPKLIEELPEGETLVTHESVPLRGMLEGMLKYSTNLTAEMVGLAATQKRIGPVADLQASAAAMNRWAIKSLGMTAPKLVDHSGLGDGSRLTALDMARALVKVRDDGLRPILKPFKMRDAKGRTIKDHPVKVEAKTGTLNFVSTLAGYLSTGEGDVMAFAIFVADEDKRAGIRREERERPPGARAWNRRAKRVQQALIERWGVIYGT
ncbi:MAG: D-alanyl-D-alanine carboxypeptidase/D-alanyl-D-alanine-endopeptidase [Sulfitobacter sp.]|nr:D-alanyl-D-alanine carboxypeptidase/D-alanyl-D-alanine-endopeptidase [Sulfitobacter sp.]